MTNYTDPRDRLMGKDPHPRSGHERGPWIQTSTGKMFHYGDVRPEDISINDIANGIAKECRYAGQTDIDTNYSVAEHSVLMTRHAYETLHWGERASLCVLLHDAAEAYIKDIPSPFKHLLGDTYGFYEEKIMRAILEKYDLVSDYEKAGEKIKELDRMMLAQEVDVLFPNGVLDWGYDRGPKLDQELQLWYPSNAKHAFLIAFMNLTRLAKIPVNEEVAV